VIRAVAAVFAAPAAVVVCGAARVAVSVVGGAALPVVFQRHSPFVELGADVLVPVSAGVSGVLDLVWRRAFPAVVGISGPAWDFPCSEQAAAREVDDRWDEHPGEQHLRRDWQAAHSGLPLREQGPHRDP